jgi:small subunit ribosomal protein S6
MVNQYETVFILTPVLSESQVKETVKKFRTLLTDNGAEMVHEEDWGLRKLAYPIKKMSNGYYLLFEFRADSKVIGILELTFRRDERVIRFLTTRMEKYAVEWAEKKRSGKRPVIPEDEVVVVNKEKEE